MRRAEEIKLYFKVNRMGVVSKETLVPASEVESRTTQIGFIKLLEGKLTPVRKICELVFRALALRLKEVRNCRF